MAAGNQTPKHPCTASVGILAGNGIEAEHPGLKRASIRDAGSASSSVTWFATMQTTAFLFLLLLFLSTTDLYTDPFIHK